MKKKQHLPCRILTAICCGMFVVVEEGDPERPETFRTYVESTEEIVSRARYRAAWEAFAGS